MASSARNDMKSHNKHVVFRHNPAFPGADFCLLDRLKATDFVKVNNVPEIPTDNQIGAGYRRYGYVQGIIPARWRKHTSRQSRKASSYCANWLNT
jgi:hypothetical protein